MKRAAWLVLAGLLGTACAAGSLQANEPAVYYKGKGDAAYRAERYAEAVLQYQTALRISPGFPECHYMLGEVYLKQQMYTFAEKSFLRALAMQARFEYRSHILDCRLGLAQAYLKLGQALDPSLERNEPLANMEKQLRLILEACGENGEFGRPNPRYEVNRGYYLGKTHFILGVLSRDKNQDTIWPGHFEQALIHEYKKATCLYYLWEYWQFNKRDSAKAAQYRSLALMEDPDVFKRGLSRPKFSIFRLQ